MCVCVRVTECGGGGGGGGGRVAVEKEYIAGWWRIGNGICFIAFISINQ